MHKHTQGRQCQPVTLACTHTRTCTCTHAHTHTNTRRHHQPATRASTYTSKHTNTHAHGPTAAAEGRGPPPEHMQTPAACVHPPDQMHGLRLCIPRDAPQLCSTQCWRWVHTHFAEGILTTTAASCVSGAGPTHGRCAARKGCDKKPSCTPVRDHPTFGFAAPTQAACACTHPSMGGPAGRPNTHAPVHERAHGQAARLLCVALPEHLLLQQQHPAPVHLGLVREVAQVCTLERHLNSKQAPHR